MADLGSWFTRIDAVQARLMNLAGPHPETMGLTRPDPATGEQWEEGQAWGHMAEFIQFWVEQAGDVIDAYKGSPVPFGRTRSDPNRLAGIEQGRHLGIDDLWEEVRADLADLRGFLEALPPGWDVSVGLHPTLGAIRADRILEDFVIGHLEEHADQLEEMRGRRT